VPLPATSHEDVAARLAGRLTGKEIVLVTPGTLGSYVMARALARAGATLPLAFAETGTLPSSRARRVRPRWRPRCPPANLPVGVFPASRRRRRWSASARSSRRRGRAWTCWTPRSPTWGPVIHPPLVLVNAASIDGGRFDVHAAGTSPSARKLIDRVDAERVAARHGLGYRRRTTTWPRRTTTRRARARDSTAPAPRPS